MSEPRISFIPSPVSTFGVTMTVLGGWVWLEFRLGPWWVVLYLWRGT